MDFACIGLVTVFFLLSEGLVLLCGWLRGS